MNIDSLRILNCEAGARSNSHCSGVAIADFWAKQKHTHTHTNTHTHTHTNTYTNTNTHIHKHTYTYTNTHTHTLTHTYTSTHIHTNAHTQTHTPHILCPCQLRHTVVPSASSARFFTYQTPVRYLCTFLTRGLSVTCLREQ